MIALLAETTTGLSHEALATIWFVLLGVLLAGYAVLDGFDLGVGMMHPFAGRTDEERRIVLNSIGPLWDGNEVWLVTFGGALFAAFPEAYATIFSAYYDALFVVLFGLVLRAVSIEFRSKEPGRLWRRGWDLVFFGSSVLVTFVFGLAVGGAMTGIPLDARHEFTGTLADLVHPFGVMAGVLAVALFALHGALYLYLKTEGDLQARILPRIRLAYVVFVVAFVLASILAVGSVPNATHNLSEMPLLWIIPALNAAAVLSVGAAVARERPALAFAASCASVVAFVALLGVTLFPHLAVSTVDPEVNGLTVFNASSSTRTLELMLLIAGLGLPCVLTYTGIVYWTFRGKVKLDPHSY